MDDFERKGIWEGHLRVIKSNNMNYLQGSKGFTMAMNKYGDLVSTQITLNKL